MLFALSLNVLIGFTGNVSFGHAAYFAIGGYACAILLTTYDWPLLFALPAAVVLAGMVAAVVGYFCVRLTQIYFAMLTLAFAMLVWGVAFKWKEVTGGDDGFTGIKLPAMLAHHTSYFYFTLAVVAAGDRGALGDLSFGLRPHAGGGAREQRAHGLHRRRHAPHALGGLHRRRHVRRARGGAVRHVPPRHVHRERLLDRIGQVLIMVLLGGIYSFVGPIIGAAVLYLLQVFTNQYTPYWPTVLGLILLVIVLVLPDGLIGLAARVRAYRRRGSGHEHHAAHRRACGSPSPASSPRATCRSTSKAGETHAVIGPNGAGKTTFFNLITGHLGPTRGAVSFEGRDLVGLPPQKIVRLGIARSFQRINIYPRLTVFENVQVALIAHERQQWNLFRPGRSLHREGTQELLELVGLAGEAARDRRRAELRQAEAARACDRARLPAAPAAARRADRRHVAAGDGRDHRLGARYREGARAHPAVHRA